MSGKEGDKKSASKMTLVDRGSRLVAVLSRALPVMSLENQLSLEASSARPEYTAGGYSDKR